MKRDWDVIRSILFEMEAREPGKHLEPDYEDRVKAEHMKLLIDAGFCTGNAGSYFEDGFPAATITRITWEGYELLDSIRDPGVWAKILGVLKSQGGGIAVDVLKKLSVQFVLDSVKSQL